MYFVQHFKTFACCVCRPFLQDKNEGVKGVNTCRFVWQAKHFNPPPDPNPQPRNIEIRAV